MWVTSLDLRAETRVYTGVFNEEVARGSRRLRIHHGQGARRRPTGSAPTSDWSPSPTFLPTGAPRPPPPGRTRASTPITGRCSRPSGSARLRRHRHAAQRPRGRRARGAGRGLHVLCEKPLAATIDEARAMLRHATRAPSACSTPATTTSTRRSSRRCAASSNRAASARFTSSRCRPSATRTRRASPEWRTDWRRERRYSGGGIAMDHGSHTFYLAFEWLRAYPTAITARACRDGRRSTPRTTSPAACASRPASRRRT